MDGESGDGDNGDGGEEAHDVRLISLDVSEKLARIVQRYSSW